MKIAKIVGLVVFCCVGSSYGMENNNKTENNTQDLVIKLSEADEHLTGAITVVENMHQKLMLAHFTRKGHDIFVATEKGKAIDLANQAKEKIQFVLDDTDVHPDLKKQAELLSLSIDTLIQNNK